MSAVPRESSWVECQLKPGRWLGGRTKKASVEEPRAREARE